MGTLSLEMPLNTSAKMALEQENAKGVHLETNICYVQTCSQLAKFILVPLLCTENDLGTNIGEDVL